MLTIAMVAGTGRAVRADTQDARKHYDRATAAFGLGHYADAAAEYEAAFGLRPDPALLYNSAQSYRLAGNKARAAELYRNYVRLYGSAANADDARRHLDDLELQLAAERAVPTSPATPPATSEPAAPADNSTAVAAAPATPAPTIALAAPPPASPPTVVATPQPALDVNGAERPVYKRPWFWIAVGAAVAGGTVAIILATKGDRDPTATFGLFPVN